MNLTPFSSTTSWTLGTQLLALAIILLTIGLIIWVFSKAGKKGQAEKPPIPQFN
jgi:cbb3-type cytochrome oxidase subunit 3